jgi:hypothetical protein
MLLSIIYNGSVPTRTGEQGVVPYRREVNSGPMCVHTRESKPAVASIA